MNHGQAETIEEVRDFERIITADCNQHADAEVLEGVQDVAEWFRLFRVIEVCESLYLPARVGPRNREDASPHVPVLHDVACQFRIDLALAEQVPLLE